MKKLINIFRCSEARRCAALTGLVSVMLLFSGSAWATYYIAGIDVGNYPAVAMTNDSYTYEASSNTTVSFKIYNTANYAQTDGYYVYGYDNGGKLSVEMGTGYTLNGTDVTEFQFAVTSGSTYTISISDNVLTVTKGSTPCDQTEVPIVVNGSINVVGNTATITGSTITDYADMGVTAQGVRFGTTNSSGSNTQYAADASGSPFNTTIGASLTGGTTYYYEAYATNCAGTGYGVLTSYTHQTGPSLSSKPVIRVGKEVHTNSDCAVIVNAYVEQKGNCATNINKFTIYYSNNRLFRSGGSYLTSHVDITPTVTPAYNTEYEFTIDGIEAGKVVAPGGVMYIRITAENNNETSAYSDIVPFDYSCGTFVHKDLSPGFKACPGMHEFNISDMFQPVVEPKVFTDAACTSQVFDAFTLSPDGKKMVWNTAGKTGPSYTYYMKASKTGYTDAVASITISYTVPVAADLGGGYVGDVTAKIGGSSFESTEPWTAVDLTATGTKGNITQLEWTVSPLTAAISNVNTPAGIFSSTAVFKAEAKSNGNIIGETTYTVTATGYSSGENTGTCASSAKSVEIKVLPDGEQECN